MLDLSILSPRQRQAVELLAEGCNNREIMEQMDIKRGTLKSYLHLAALRLGISGSHPRIKLGVAVYQQQLMSQRPGNERPSPS